MKVIVKIRSIIFLFSVILISILTFQGCTNKQTNEKPKPINLTFESHGSTLQGVFYPGNFNQPSSTVILLHGYPGGRTAPLGLGAKLMNAGINALFFNCRGVYDSEGIFTVRNYLQDVTAAVNFLHSTAMTDGFGVDTTNLSILGWSFGGSMAFIGSIDNPSLKNVITVEAGDFGHIAREFQTDEKTLKVYKHILSKTMSDSGQVKGLGPDDTIDEIIQMEKQLDLVLNAEHLANKNILIIAGWKDEGTLENQILPLFRALQKHKAKNVEIEMFNDGHRFKNVREELADVIIEWIKKNTVITQ
ncbi:MAG: prolyl oligopeptidase family serine peptidase [Candidatus Marinimicrobia bacterium]|nr:prolyl oligopeptidase family serine peptidase [Candidatus Neomarinimicrobiota bacterium]